MRFIDITLAFALVAATNASPAQQGIAWPSGLARKQACDREKANALANGLPPPPCATHKKHIAKSPHTPKPHVSNGLPGPVATAVPVPVAGEMPVPGGPTVSPSGAPVPASTSPVEGAPDVSRTDFPLPTGDFPLPTGSPPDVSRTDCPPTGGAPDVSRTEEPVAPTSGAPDVSRTDEPVSTSAPDVSRTEGPVPTEPPLAGPDPSRTESPGPTEPPAGGPDPSRTESPGLTEPPLDGAPDVSRTDSTEPTAPVDGAPDVSRSDSAASLATPTEAPRALEALAADDAASQANEEAPQPTAVSYIASLPGTNAKHGTGAKVEVGDVLGSMFGPYGSPAGAPSQLADSTPEEPMPVASQVAPALPAPYVPQSPYPQLLPPNLYFQAPPPFFPSKRPSEGGFAARFGRPGLLTSFEAGVKTGFESIGRIRHAGSAIPPASLPWYNPNLPANQASIMSPRVGWRPFSRPAPRPVAPVWQSVPLAPPAAPRRPFPRLFRKPNTAFPLPAQWASPSQPLLPGSWSTPPLPIRGEMRPQALPSLPNWQSNLRRPLAALHPLSPVQLLTPLSSLPQLILKGAGAESEGGGSQQLTDLIFSPLRILPGIAQKLRLPHHSDESEMSKPVPKPAPKPLPRKPVPTAVTNPHPVAAALDPMFTLSPEAEIAEPAWSLDADKY